MRGKREREINWKVNYFHFSCMCGVSWGGGGLCLREPKRTSHGEVYLMKLVTEDA